jgi:hypothetical protein
MAYKKKIFLTVETDETTMKALRDFCKTTGTKIYTVVRLAIRKYVTAPKQEQI